MRKNTVILILILLTNFAFAQQVKVENTKYKFISGEKHALKVNIFTDDIKDILKAFQKELEKEVGTVTEQKKELILDNVLIKSITEDKIDAYVAVKKMKDNSSELYVSFEINNEIIEPKSKAYKQAEKFMETLSKEISIVVIEKELEKEQKNLKKLQDKVVSLEDKNKKLTQDTKDREEDIKKNQSKLKEVSEELKEVNKKMNSGKGKMDKLVKDKEKLDKDHEKLTDKMSKDEKKIKDNKKDIEANEKDIENLKNDIKKQEKVVSEINDKRKAVK
ncbi:MAG: hypothetical protein CMD31_01235 [Flavobacteriales bacterium]|nr:hypothetical protein [Flavobacteriales bacterium]|tara:strand:+ start:71221 stop:72048 length:828 start_codon:yes stop_codon:yes gene_type:complete